MRCLAAVPAPAKLAGGETAVDLELVLAVDTSGFIDLAEARRQRRHHFDARTSP